ncbi:MAG: winged helix-turn-helix transcriptional regulator [Alphaproteobacteria bacterium]
MRKSREDDIIRDILVRIDDSAEVNQRALAQELGIALGMTNAYVRRCVRKGYVKIRQVPPNRYAYYLTPKGFAEKTRLTAQFLSDSFGFFRKARAQYAGLYESCVARGWTRLALAGISELGDVAMLAAREHQVELLGVIEPREDGAHFLGLPVVAEPAALGALDAILLTAVERAGETRDWLVTLHPPERVLAPKLLGLGNGNGAAAVKPAGRRAAG